MRQIDADVLKAIFDEMYDDAFMQSHTRPNKAYWEGYSAGVNWGRNTIADAPTVDAVEVVQYKELMEKHDDLRENFVDYVCSGTNNPAPYCINNCKECVDSRGWCENGSDKCKGFNPAYFII